MKKFSIVGETQRGSQSYMKRKGRREIEVTRRRRGGIKRGESSLASNQFPNLLSTVWNTQDSFTEFHREEKRRKEIEVTRRRGWGDQFLPYKFIERSFER